MKKCSKSIKACFVLSEVLFSIILICCPPEQNHSTEPSDPYRVVNYYTKDHAWEAFWNEWESTRLSMPADMALIHEIGANTIRIFIHPSCFGWSLSEGYTPSASQLAKLDEALDILRENNLQALLVLFDLFGDFSDIDHSIQWMSSLMNHYAGDDRIVMWELKNEVDMSNNTVRSWVLSIFSEFKTLAREIPVTISISAAKSKKDTWRATLEDLVANVPVDYYDVHFYTWDDVTWLAPLESDIQDAINIIGDPTKVLFHELGQTTFDDYADECQHDVLQNLFSYGIASRVSNFGVWTFQDFPDGTMIGSQPVSGPECNYGFYRLDGSEKPALSIIQKLFDGDTSFSPVLPR